jgi:hypothetical protein
LAERSHSSSVGSLAAKLAATGVKEEFRSFWCDNAPLIEPLPIPAFQPNDGSRVPMASSSSDATSSDGKAPNADGAPTDSSVQIPYAEGQTTDLSVKVTSLDVKRRMQKVICHL